ncbi:MAG: alpha/beta hydrolase [Verrucomicrobiaceae bacterium]
MNRILALSLGLVLQSGIVSPAFAGDDSPRQMPLWTAEAPIGDGKFEKASPMIHVYQPANPNGTAMVICPGGGYGGLVMGPEGQGIAKWLGGHGITGIVLQYRLPAGRSNVPLLDAQRAIRMARSNAKDWKIDPNRIGIIGFSAGGHLASTAATHFDAGNAKSDDVIEKVSCRPDFAILVYPVVTMGAKTHGGSKQNLLGRNPTPETIELFSNEKQVRDNTPPMFMAHAKDDTLVSADNSRDLHASLQAHHVASEYLELPSGGHGLNGYSGPMWTAWQEKSLEWLAGLKLLTK